MRTILTEASAVQRDVLHLYRRIAREAKSKMPEDRSTVMSFARGEFQRYVTWSTTGDRQNIYQGPAFSLI